MSTTMAAVPIEGSPPPDARLTRALAYCEGRRRQLDRAAYLAPALLAILPDISAEQLLGVIDLIAGAPADLFGAEREAEV